jgi:hypothetical protein
MAQGMENDVSDDDSDSPSYDELLELVHKHQKVVKKQYKEIKNLNDLNAILATNYEYLLCKFKLLSEKHEEFKLKIESINDTNDFLKMNQSIPCAIPISKIDASTSYIDLIDESCSNPCNEKCNENVVVESYDDLIAKENDKLKQEVERLMNNLYRLKGKGIESNVQPSQDNREDMVKKLEKGSTVTSSKCHKEGHKSNKCPQPRKKLSDEKNKKKLTIKSSLIYTKPNRRNKNNSTSYVIKKKTNGKVVARKIGKKEVVARKIGKKEKSWNYPIWVPKEIITNMKGPQMVWVPKET